MLGHILSGRLSSSHHGLCNSMVLSNRNLT